MHALEKLPKPSTGKNGWPWTEESQPLNEVMPDGRPWPRISIVTPSFNQGRYIEETLRSVLLQGYFNLEYILMDGGSTDGTTEILKRYEPYLAHLHIGPDEGQAAAIAEGFQRSDGEILAWLNSDDTYRPGTLRRIAEHFVKKPFSMFVYGDVNLIDEEGRVTKRFFVPRYNRFVTANTGMHTCLQPGCFWRRTTYEKCGSIDKSLRFCMDTDLFLRLTETGRSARISGPPLADFRRHSSSKSVTIPEIGYKENKGLVEKYSSSFFRRFPKIIKFYWWLWCKPNSLRHRLHNLFGWEF